MPNAAVGSTLRTNYNLANGDGSYSINATTNRTNLINAMATTSNWSELINNGSINGIALSAEVKSNANVWAKGAPTLDLWVNSWNTKYPSDTLYTRYDNPVSGQSYDGWYIGDEPNNLTTQTLSLSDKTGFNNTLYFPHQSVVDSCNGYWLASPSAKSDSRMLDVSYDNGNYSVRNNSYNNTSYAFRPVICLPSSIIE